MQAARSKRQASMERMAFPLIGEIQSGSLIIGEELYPEIPLCASDGGTSGRLRQIYYEGDGNITIQNPEAVDQ